MDSKTVKRSFFDSRIVMLAFILLICLNSGHAFQTIKTSLQLLVIPAFIILFAPITRELMKKKLTIYHGAVLFFFVMITATALLYFPTNYMTYFLLLCTVLTAFGITCVYSFDDVVKCYLSIMTVTAMVAIVGYYLVNNTSMLNFLPSYENVNHIEYKVSGIFNYITIIPERNCGMFWEPGLFATNLIFALVFEIVFKKTKVSVFRIIVFSWAIITANSSAGFILWIFCIWLLIIRGRKGKKQSGAWKLFSFLMFTVGIFLVMNLDNIIMGTELADNEYVLKLLSENVADSSRAQSVLFNLEIFSEYPAFGAGYYNVLSKMQFTADTSSSTYILSLFGCLGLLYTFFWIYGAGKIKGLNLFARALVSIIFILIINKESHLNLMFSWMLLFYLLKNHSEQKEMAENENDQESLVGQGRT